jgi:hypothetical protein
MALCRKDDGAYVNRLLDYSQERNTVVKTFLDTWAKGTPPSEDDVKVVYSIYNGAVEANYQRYCGNLRSSNIDNFYHGTVVKCSMQSTGRLCHSDGCGVCGIVQQGFSPEKRGMHVNWFKRFGHAYYLAPNSSKCHEYSEGYGQCRALLYCQVAQGNRYMAESNMAHLKAPPSGYDCVYGQPGIHRARGGNLNYAEVAVYNNNAILPKYVIFYEKDGVKLKL